ncbi:hypothetical protein [Actinocorallia longicatena]|uniref:Class III extradiol dioxygenase subunit B-like domain-containing protein n=1 Tax=Actinocorallia longicatena TaxID=111803 RepID=A0ABP6QJ47_9ACTN
MLIAAAVCPHPPLLVPEIAGEAASELDALRAAADRAVLRVCARRAGGSVEDPPRRIVVVGGGAETRSFGASASGSLRPYGLDLAIGSGAPELPLSLTLGRWLLERASGACVILGDGRLVMPSLSEVSYQSVALDASAQECLELGRALAADDVALLVMGDGSACRDEKAPGYLDERAVGYDARVAAALKSADASALAALDPVESRELMAAGRAAWQVLAGAAAGRPLTGELLADEAPYGVGYFVASWT